METVWFQGGIVLLDDFFGSHRVHVHLVSCVVHIIVVQVLRIRNLSYLRSWDNACLWNYLFA